MIIYRRDLKNLIKNKLIRYKKHVTTLEKLIKISITLDNKLFKRVIKRYFKKILKTRAGFAIIKNPRKIEASIPQKDSINLNNI